MLGAAIAIDARSRKPEDSLETVKGVAIASRRPCDGATTTQEEVELVTTFSPGGVERSFNLDVFQASYCRYADLYFICVKHGRDRWKHDWSADSQGPPPERRFWLNTCAAPESRDAPRYLLSGWYRETGAGKKEPWKQAELKKVEGQPETYEFSAPGGGTARLQVVRR
jgi:hypothetical protein